MRNEKADRDKLVAAAAAYRTVLALTDRKPTERGFTTFCRSACFLTFDDKLARVVFRDIYRGKPISVTAVNEHEYRGKEKAVTAVTRAPARISKDLFNLDIPPSPDGDGTPKKTNTRLRVIFPDFVFGDLEPVITIFLANYAAEKKSETMTNGKKAQLRSDLHSAMLEFGRDVFAEGLRAANERSAPNIGYVQKCCRTAMERARGGARVPRSAAAGGRPFGYARGTEQSLAEAGIDKDHWGR